MNCHEPSRTVADAFRHNSRGDPRVPCEFHLCASDVASVMMTGTMLGPAQRLVLARQRSGCWVARLLLGPGRHRGSCRVLWQGNSNACPPTHATEWNMEFTVPAQQDNTGVIAEVRYRLIVPNVLHASIDDCHA